MSISSNVLYTVKVNRRVYLRCWYILVWSREMDRPKLNRLNIDIDFSWHGITALVISYLTFLISVWRYVGIRLGAWVQPWNLGTWEKVGYEVANGARLYVDVIDNKPPLFELLVVGGGLIGDVPLILFTVAGLVNAYIVFWIYVTVLENGQHEVAAVLAAFLALLGLTAIDGWANNKVPGVALGILALLVISDRDFLSGALFGAGLMINQFLILSTPVFAWQLWNQSRFSSLIRWGSSALAIVLLSFGVVAVAWGPEAAVNGAYYSFGIAFSYWFETGPITGGASPFSEPGRYMKILTSRFNLLKWHFLLATIPFIYSLKEKIRLRDMVSRSAWNIILFGVFLSFALAVRPGKFRVITPSLLLLSGIGVDILIRGVLQISDEGFDNF